MNANHYLHHELRQLENAAAAALCQIRNSRSIRGVVQGMSVQVPPILRPVRRLANSYPRLEPEAHRRAESIVRSQIATLSSATSEEEFHRLRNQYMQEWRLLNGRFPKLASMVQVEGQKALARLRAQDKSQSRCSAPTNR